MISFKKTICDVPLKAILYFDFGKNLVYKHELNINNLFNSVEIETTTICNRKCDYCPNSTVGRPRGFMDEKLFYKIIDELSALEYSGRISPHFYGEPLMDKRIVGFVGYMRKKLPAAHIKLFTNGDLLTYDLFNELSDAGVDIFRIAQHSEKPSETITDTLNRLDKETVKNRIEYVKYHNNKNILMNRGGLIRTYGHKFFKKTDCELASGLTIDYLGNCVLCCNDYLSRYVFGNLKNESIMDVWNKKGYKIIRSKIECGIWPYDICRVCVQ